MLLSILGNVPIYERKGKNNNNSLIITKEVFYDVYTELNIFHYTFQSLLYHTLL